MNITKEFAESARDQFEVARQVGAWLTKHEMPAPALREIADLSLTFEHAEGPAINDLHQALDPNSYCGMLCQLGQAMAAYHRADHDALSFTHVDGLSPNHLGESRRRWQERNRIVATFLEGEQAQICGSLLACANARIFQSPPALIHGNIHRENVFITDRAVLVDWETAAIQPRELDFVHPYLSIFSEAFPGHRLGECELGSRFFAAFERGYGERVDWPVVACHGALWYMERAAEAPPGDLQQSYLNTGLGGMAFAASAGAPPQ